MASSRNDPCHDSASKEFRAARPATLGSPMQSEASEAGLPLQRGCPRCGAPVPSANLELHLLRCQPAGVVGSVFGAASGEQWPCSSCTSQPHRHAPPHRRPTPHRPTLHTPHATGAHRPPAICLPGEWPCSSCTSTPPHLLTPHPTSSPLTLPIHHSPSPFTTHHSTFTPSPTSGEQWPCSSCTFLNAEEQRCCAMCGGVRDAAGAEAQSPARGAAVLGSVFTGATDEAEAGREGRETDDAGREMLTSLMARNGLQDAEQEAARGPEARAVAAANRMQQARTASSGSYALDTTLSRSITWSSPLSRSISWPSPPLTRCARRWPRRGVSVRC